MFEWIYSPEAWVALGTLTALEIVLGIDNIIFISVLVVVEIINIHMRNKRAEPVHLHKTMPCQAKG